MDNKIADLIRKYNAGQCTAEEKKLVEHWYQSFEWSDKSEYLNEDSIADARKEVWEAMQAADATLANTNHIERSTGAVTGIRWKFIAAAAAVALLVFGTLFWQKPGNNEKPQVAAVQPLKAPVADVLPGSQKASLQLANGSVVALDSAQNMQLQEEDGTSIDKQSGKLVYTGKQDEGDRILFNTLTTPRGGEYQLVLPDGSKVWLNAASSLKFPTRFKGNERTVYLQGEAYFEVAKNKAMPFHVKLDDETTVEVLGTHFNIMGYHDEGEIKTTLAEGAVKVTRKDNSVYLTPAKEAIVAKAAGKLTVADADVNKALAWKNGMIEFDGDNLPYIMRQLSRWYDVDVSFAGNLSGVTYKGAIRRQAPLSAVLEILKMAGVQYKTEQKKVTITGG